jgi:L-ascorbate metabolism protein UlaG (beta-lactamase superfamily)
MKRLITFVCLFSLAIGVPTLLGAAETTQGFTIYYEENAQVELINPAGTRILIDVYRPDLLSSPATEKDVLLTTHSHPDHVNSDFFKSFPGKQLMKQVGEIKLPDVIIQGLASAHNATDKIVTEGATNYIYVMDIGGLRIAHFGDIGQDALIPEQLTTLGKVDIAIMQLSNSFSSMSASNQKGFNLMDQVKPRLLIPTHLDMNTAKIAAEKWLGVYTDQKSVTITPADLSNQTRILFMGMLAPSYQKLFNLPAWGAVK